VRAALDMSVGWGGAGSEAGFGQAPLELGSRHVSTPQEALHLDCIRLLLDESD